jgi:hypothetical protein
MDRDATERLADFQRAYMEDPEFVDRHYQVPSLADLLSEVGVVGVARFIEFPSFEPERLFTVVYRPKVIEVSAVIGASSLWWSMSQGERFDPRRGGGRQSVSRRPKSALRFSKVGQRSERRRSAQTIAARQTLWTASPTAIGWPSASSARMSTGATRSCQSTPGRWRSSRGMCNCSAA